MKLVQENLLSSEGPRVRSPGGAKRLIPAQAMRTQSSLCTKAQALFYQEACVRLLSPSKLPPSLHLKILFPALVVSDSTASVSPPLPRPLGQPSPLEQRLGPLLLFIFVLFRFQELNFHQLKSPYSSFRGPSACERPKEQDETRAERGWKVLGIPSLSEWVK